MKLVVGNKNYSSWSMRPWVLMREFDIPFEEQYVRFDSFAPGSSFKQTVGRLSPTQKVPLLVLDDGQVVWDTLAIAETLAERFPDKHLWPRDAARRARARSNVCEMHSGFAALRQHFAMNIEASLPEVGQRVLASQPAARAELERVDAMWREAIQASGGPFLFGDYSIADAYYAPMACRMRTYALPLSPESAGWVERVLASKGVAAWVRDAAGEKDFLEFEEPYRKHPG